MTEIKGGDWVIIAGGSNDPCIVAGFMRDSDIVELYRPGDGAKLWVRKWGLRRIEHMQSRGLEETLRDRLSRMESKIDRLLADLAEIRATFDRIDAMKRDMEPER